MRTACSAAFGLCWFLLLCGAGSVLVWPELSASTQNLGWPGAHPVPLSTMVLAAGIFLTGGVTLGRSWFSAGETRTDPLMPVVVGISVLGFAGALERQVTFVGAAVAVGLASGAFMTVWLLILALWRGEAIEVESRGGLGGDLGGWRLSRSASLALLALVLVVASVAVLQPHAAPESAGSGTAGVGPAAPPAAKAGLPRAGAE